MHPQLIPGIPWLHSYGLMLVIAFYSAYFLSRWTARRERLDPRRMVDVLLLSAVLGIVGSRALYVIHYKDQIRGLLDVLAIWQGGLVFYGGLIAATIGLIIYFRVKKLPMWRFADAAAPAIMLGLAFGRIGCFLNGCCWGARADESCPLAVRFPRLPRSISASAEHGSDWRVTVTRGAPGDLYGRYRQIDGERELDAYLAEYPGSWREVPVVWWRVKRSAHGEEMRETITGSYAYLQHLVKYPEEIGPKDAWSLPVHPSQLYSSFSAFAICGLLLLWRRWRRRPGEVFALMACLYSIARFSVEFFRDDTAPVAGPFTLAQVTGAPVFLVALAAFVACRVRRRKT
jgi:prolipoprotein diacylglyceryltransferase